MLAPELDAALAQVPDVELLQLLTSEYRTLSQQQARVGAVMAEA